MTVKEYLSLVKLKQEQITEKEEYIARLRRSLEIIGIDYDRDSVQTSPDGDKYADTFGKIMEAETDLIKMKKMFVNFRVKVLDMIQKLPEKKHRDVLQYVYLDYMKLKKCAVIMGFSYDYVRELHLEALKAFEQKFPQQFD